MLSEPLSESAQRVWQYICERQWRVSADTEPAAGLPEGAAWRTRTPSGQRRAPAGSRWPAQQGRWGSRPAATRDDRFGARVRESFTPHQYRSRADQLARFTFNPSADTPERRDSTGDQRGGIFTSGRDDVPQPSGPERGRRPVRSDAQSVLNDSVCHLGPPQHASTPASVAPCSFADEIISASQARLNVIRQRRPQVQSEDTPTIPSPRRPTGPSPRRQAIVDEPATPANDSAIPPLSTGEHISSHGRCPPDSVSKKASSPRDATSDGGRYKSVKKSPRVSSGPQKTSGGARAGARAPPIVSPVQRASSLETPRFSLLSPFGLSPSPIFGGAGDSPQVAPRASPLAKGTTGGSPLVVPETQLSEQVPVLSEAASAANSPKTPEQRSTDGNRPAATTSPKTPEQQSIERDRPATDKDRPARSKTPTTASANTRDHQSTNRDRPARDITQSTAHDHRPARCRTPTDSRVRQNSAGRKRVEHDKPAREASAPASHSVSAEAPDFDQIRAYAGRKGEKSPLGDKAKSMSKSLIKEPVVAEDEEIKIKIRRTFNPKRRSSDDVKETTKRARESPVTVDPGTQSQPSGSQQDTSKDDSQLMRPPLHPVFRRRAKGTSKRSSGAAAVDKPSPAAQSVSSRGAQELRQSNSPRQETATGNRSPSSLQSSLSAAGSAITSLSADQAESLARALQDPATACVCLCLELGDGGSQLRPADETARPSSSALAPRYVSLVAGVTGGPADGMTVRLKPESLPADTVSAVTAALLAGPGRRVCWSAREVLLFALRHCGVPAADALRRARLRDLAVADWLLEPDRPARRLPSLLTELGGRLGAAAARDAALSRQQQLAADLRLLDAADTAVSSRLRAAGLLTLFERVEAPLTAVLAAMEARGVRVDVARLHSAAAACQRRLRTLEAEAHRAAGTMFSLSSAAQLRRLLYDELRLDARAGVTVPLTDSGHKSTCETALQRLGAAHPLPGLVMQHRRLLKFRSTYMEGLLGHVRGGAVFPQWLQTAAATGRVQAAAPNLQSVPKRPLSLVDGARADDQSAVLARSPFVARAGHTLLGMDFRQMELRLLAHLSRDEHLTAAIRDAPEGDIFRQLAALWTSQPAHSVDEAERERTKRVVYAVMYGAGRERLAGVLQCSPQQAQHTLDSFLAHCPAIGAFSGRAIADCRRDGFVSSLLGRRRYVAAIMSKEHLARSQAERQAVNFIIQGSASDLCKLMMLAVTEAAPDVPLLAQLHDELLWEVPRERVSEFRALVEREVGRLDELVASAGHAEPLTVPLPIALSVGDCWANMEPMPSPEQQGKEAGTAAV